LIVAIAHQHLGDGLRTNLAIAAAAVSCGVTAVASSAEALVAGCREFGKKLLPKLGLIFLNFGLVSRFAIGGVRPEPVRLVTLRAGRFSVRAGV
jgi:hypothetical protein